LLRWADCPVFGIEILSNAYADMVLFLIDRLPVAMRFGIIHLPNLYTTIPNHPGEMPEGTLRAILNQAGLDVDAFLNR
jgi:hypothetical protein